MNHAALSAKTLHRATLSKFPPQSLCSIESKESPFSPDSLWHFIFMHCLVSSPWPEVSSRHLKIYIYIYIFLNICPIFSALHFLCSLIQIYIQNSNVIINGEKEKRTCVFPFSFLFFSFLAHCASPKQSSPKCQNEIFPAKHCTTARLHLRYQQRQVHSQGHCLLPRTKRVKL